MTSFVCLLAGRNRLVDPNLRRHGQWFWRPPDEAVWMRLVSGIEHRLAVGQDGLGLAEMNHGRGQQTDAGMAVRSGPRFLDSPVRWIGGMENGEKQCQEHAKLIRRA